MVKNDFLAVKAFSCGEGHDDLAALSAHGAVEIKFRLFSVDTRSQNRGSMTLQYGEETAHGTRITKIELHLRANWTTHEVETGTYVPLLTMANPPTPPPFRRHRRR